MVIVTKYRSSLINLARACVPLLRKRLCSGILVSCLPVTPVVETLISPPTEISSVPSLINSKEYLKTPCLNNVNAATSLITTLVTLLESAANNYMLILDQMCGILQTTLILDGMAEHLSDSLVELRSMSEEAKGTVYFLQGYWQTVRKVTEAITEASFNVDAEYLCSTLCERSEAANTKVQELLTAVKNKENDYLLALRDVANQQQKN